MSLVSTVIGGMSYFGFQELTALSSNINENVVPRNNLLVEMDVNYQKTRIAVRTLGLENLDKVDRDQAIKDSLKAVAAYESAANLLEQRVTNSIEREFFNKVKKHWVNFKGVGVRAIELAKVYDQEAKNDLHDIFITHCPAAAEQYQISLDSYLDFIKNEVKTSSAKTKKTSNLFNLLILFVSIGGIIIGLITGFIFASKISNNIKETIEKLTQSSNFLTSSANSIADSSLNLSSSSEQQNSSLQESSSSLEEISSMVRMTADNAIRSNELAGESLNKASHGKQVVSQVICSMDGINSSIDTIVNELSENNNKMKEITELINKIDEKTQIIDDIVFQTKLLSFNASVEAARAGEAGKGFTVVAEEVGKLAQLSGKASIEIAEMVDSSVNQVNKIVEDSQQRISVVISDVRKSVANGSNIADECGSLLENIVESVSSVSCAISEISTATQEQSKGIEELQNSMLQVDSASKSNSEIAKGASEIASTLQEQVINMNGSISEIQNVIFGDFKNNKKAS